MTAPTPDRLVVMAEPDSAKFPSDLTSTVVPDRYLMHAPPFTPTPDPCAHLRAEIARLQQREAERAGLLRELQNWQPMDSAPKNATEIVIQCKDKLGYLSNWVLHWAHGGGEDQPPFGPGWFRNDGYGYAELNSKFTPVRWRRIDLEGTRLRNAAGTTSGKE